MLVSRAHLERCLEQLTDEVADPAAGIYGPGSLAWRIDREGALFLGGGRAALLQLAHPFVAHAVDQHSETRRDPLGRFQRTFDNVFKMVFGDLERALSSARRVHAIHTRITGVIEEDVGAFVAGTPYQANDAASLMWVHATLLDTSLLMYEHAMGPLSDTDKGQYYLESKRFGRLFGLSDDELPADYGAFVAYMKRMLDSNQIAVGRPAREIARFLFVAPRPAYRPAFAWLATMTAGLLTPRLRREFELPWGPAHAATVRASLSLMRRTYPRLPSRMRYLPAYVRAQRRLVGDRRPDRLGDWMEKLVLSSLKPRSEG